MKYTIALLITAFLFASCAEKKDPKRELEEKNLATYYEAAALKMNPDSSGFDAFVDKYIDENFVDRTSSPNDSLPKGREGFKVAMRHLHKAFSKSVTTIEHVAADSDVVIVHHSGTHRMGDGHDVMLLKYKDGKVIEHWAFH